MCASFKKMAATAFLQALNFAVVECDVSVVFKVAQVRALEAVYLGRDVIGVLPTGFGKSLIFQLIPDLINFKRHTMSSEQTGGCGDVKRDLVVIVVCPLDSLMANHSESLILRGISSVVLRSGKIESAGKAAGTSDSSDEDLPELEYELLMGRETVKKVQNGEFSVVFSHPEAIVASKEGRALLQNKFFQSKVVACIVDEAHCIENW